MGKIFDALERFTKDSGGSVSERIKDSDYEALMQFDEVTGKIDLHHSNDTNDPRILKRLKTYRLINADGTLTPAGIAKFEKMKRTHDDPEPAGQMRPRQLNKQTPQETPAKKPPGLDDPDWALLMKHDRKTGNLLKCDPETGQLDSESRNILRDPATVQRLIDNQMILPGGWLTPEAKRECGRIEENLQTKQLKGAGKQEKITIGAKLDEPSVPTEVLGQAEMQALMDYDPQTLKLNMSSSFIIKDPAIVRRLLENEMIDAEGKLSPKALVRCRVLTDWTSELEKRKRAQEAKKQSSAEKLQISPQKRKMPPASGETAKGKLKIIRLKKDKEKAPKKDDVSIPVYKSPDEKPDTAPAESRFALGKTSPRYDKNAIDKNLVSLLNPQSFEAEQFKILRTNLLFPTSGKAPRSIMVTSTFPGEGKSFVASNLAISVARHLNWNVLLIDCDLRKPSIHRQFGFKNVSGLSNYLTNGVSLPPLMLRTAVDHLTILPAGRLPSNPSELISSDRMFALLKEVTTRYDDRLIILDSPPPKLTAESGALARQVDGILLVVKYASTPRETVTALISKLGKDKILGAIVNNFDTGSSRYHKKYYGGAYYG